MTVTEQNREQFFQEKLLEKYANSSGITDDLLWKIEDGTATEAELTQYTNAADGLVMRFKSDLSKTEPENYDELDLQILMAMIDANYLKFSNNQESYSKVIPTTGVQSLLKMQYGNPTILNFSALSRYSENLSPQQIISQFGLDYEYQSNGEMVTPYLAQEGTGNVKRQPFVFTIETPMNEGIKANAKLPMDPRIIDRLEQISSSNTNIVSEEAKQQATDFLTRNKDNICFIARGTENKTTLETKYANKYKIINAQDPPYTGNTAPQYGKKLEAENPYADVIQEMFMTKATEVSAGTKIYGKFPLDNNIDRAERPNLPAGSENIAIASWDGEKWEVLVSEEELQDKFDNVLRSYPENIRQQWESKRISKSQVAEWKNQGDEKIRLVKSTTTETANTPTNSTTTETANTSTNSTTTETANTSTNSTTTETANTPRNSTTTDEVTTPTNSTTTDEVTTPRNSTTTETANTPRNSTTTDEVTTPTNSTTTDEVTTPTNSITTDEVTTPTDSTTTETLSPDSLKGLVTSISNNILGKLQATPGAEKSNTNQQAAISYETFRQGMTDKYRENFISEVVAALGTREQSLPAEQKTSPEQKVDRAMEYFRTFVKALYNNRIQGLGKGYGNFEEGGAEGEKGRQNLVDAFYQETSEFIRAFGPIAAKGSTLLWSSYGIGRFAVDDKDILKSAGVTDENAQALSQTAIGKVWDQLKIAEQSDEQIGYIWDSQYQVWASVSKELAANAEGEVHVFLPKNIGASTVFWNVELPELRQRMAKFTDDPKVTKITIHRLTDDALKRVNDAENDAAKKQVMLKSSSWENLDFSQASLEVPNFSDKQKELLKDSNPSLFAQMENYVSSNKTAATITIGKLTKIARGWKEKAKTLAGMDIELYRKIADKYGHFATVPFDIAQKIAKGEATDGELKQYADKLVKAFQNDLSLKQPQDYSDSDLEIITRLLHENYTRLQKPASQEISTKVISKTEIGNLLKKESGDPKLAGFNNFYDYSEKLSVKDTIEQFGLDYQYTKNGQTVKPYLMSENSKDKTVPFVYYVMTPMTDDIKNNTKIPLDSTVKTKLEAIANDTTRDDNDELKKMAKALTTTGVYHELTPNTGNDQPKYGTQADGKKSYADMLRTTYSTSGSQMSVDATIRAKGPNGEDIKIADWNGLTWTVSPQSAADLPDWLKNKGRTEDRLNVDSELKAWKRVGDNKVTPPTKIPAPVRAFMEHHFQTSLADITIQKVASSTTNDDSSSTVIKFQPGEYDDTTEEGLKKIAQKLGDAVKLKVANNGNQLDVSKAITAINNELPTKSVSIKNELMKLRKPRTSVAGAVKAVRRSKSRYNTGKTSSQLHNRPQLSSR